MTVFDNTGLKSQQETQAKAGGAVPPSHLRFNHCLPQRPNDPHGHQFKDEQAYNNSPQSINTRPISNLQGSAQLHSYQR